MKGAPNDVIDSHRQGRLIGTAHLKVVAEMFTDIGQFMNNWNSMTLKKASVTDSRQFEDLW